MLEVIAKVFNERGYKHTSNSIHGKWSNYSSELLFQSLVVGKWQNTKEGEETEEQIQRRIKQITCLSLTYLRGISCGHSEEKWPERVLGISLKVKV